MNKTCARCEKTVYPTEELKCLDKVWHKGCFKCQECGMTLNMRTYKGYGKLPYCEAHVPKAKHTTMAETPELKRIAENTKIQSNVKYHADFEKSKGKFTQVADDPETLRIKANTKIISNVAYHGDLEKKAHMERQRLINENGEIVEVPSTDNYHQQIESYATEMLPPAAPAPAPAPAPAHYQYAPQDHQKHHYYSNQYQNMNPPPPPAPQNNSNNYEDYHYSYGQYQQHNMGVSQQQKIGRIQDYDPLSDGPRVPPATQRATTTLIYNSTNEPRQKGGHRTTMGQGRAVARGPEMALEDTHTNTRPQMAPAVNQRVFIAMYDYEANDSDEVSFREGDLISNVTSIDSGWMTGQVLRTGRAGMLPANYVEPAPPHYRA